MNRPPTASLPTVTWKDVEWVRAHWPGKLILKGILDCEDAKRACEVGADALVVSNHGGRQLEGAPSSISLLSAIVQAAASHMLGTHQTHPR